MATQSLTAADADHDGDIDLLVSNAGSRDVSFYANNGDGTFAPIIRYGTFGAALEVLCVDLTGDGVNDLITSGFTASPTSIDGIVVIPGIPDFIIGDVNGDGVVNLLDVAPFVTAVSNGDYIPAADTNQDGAINLLDVDPFVGLLAGN